MQIGFYIDGLSLNSIFSLLTAWSVFAAASLLAYLLLIGFIWVLPILIILKSDQTEGNEKLAWILAVLFISWFAWVFYLLLAPLKPKK